MIEGEKYIAIVKQYYSFLETEFDFKKVNETINGNVFYDVEYLGIEKVISISYENIENHLEIIIFMIQDGRMPNYDDKTRTLHLNQLNRMIMTKVHKDDFILNTEYFAKYNAKDEIEQQLLKGAKELRLYLKHC